MAPLADTLVRRLLLVVTVLAALPSVSAFAEPVPQEAAGVWGETGCNDGSRMFLLNASYVMAVRFSGTSAAVAVHPVQWAAGTVLADTGQGMEILPLAGLKRCRSLPPLLHAGFGEAIALFRAYDDFHAHCGGDTPMSCLEAVFSEVDVSDDERLSEAEVGRAVRAAGFFLAQRTIVSGRMKEPPPDRWPAHYAPVERLYGTAALSVLAGSVVIGNLVRSYDYDGDGFLSLEELMQDRLPDDLVGVVGGLASAGALSTLDGALRALPGLMGTFTQLLGLLR